MKKRNYIALHPSRCGHSRPVAFICAIALTCFTLPGLAHAQCNSACDADSTVFGYNASDTVSGTNNTVIGAYALEYYHGNDNTAVGAGALHNINANASENTAVGSEALNGSTNMGVPNSTGSYNTATGFQALFSNHDGSYNTADGWKALNS